MYSGCGRNIMKITNSILFYSNPSYPRGRRRCAQVVTCGPATRELEAPSPAVEEAAEGDATSSSAVSHADA